MPDSDFVGPANLLVMPNLDAANISYNLLRIAAGNGVTVGGILLGAAKAAHILTPSATVRRIVNMAAFAAVDASQRSAPLTERLQGVYPISPPMDTESHEGVWCSICGLRGGKKGSYA